jgi:hypothetical protein
MCYQCRTAKEYDAHLDARVATKLEEKKAKAEWIREKAAVIAGHIAGGREANPECGATDVDKVADFSRRLAEAILDATEPGKSK